MPPKRIILDDRLYVQASTIPNAGKGLFALKRIAANNIIGEYVGVQLPVSASFDTSLDRSYFMQTLPYYDRGNGAKIFAFIIDGKQMDNKMRWINDPRYDKARLNAIAKQTGEGRLFVYSLRAIHPGEEILMNYGADYWKAEEAKQLSIWLDY
jgi:SET domain-containing protein